MTQRPLSLFMLFMLLTACGSRKAEEAIAPQPVAIRYSCAITRFYRSAPVTQWLERPAKMYFQSHFFIPADLAEDVIFGINLGFSEGVSAPLYFEGANWHSMAGLTRDGRLWLAYGTEMSFHGVPSDASSWETIDLGIAVKPETWYLIRLEADFGSRSFSTLSLQGPGVRRSVNLSEFPIDYPFDSPFDQRNLSFSVWALRNPGMMETSPGSTKVWFDQVEGGLEVNGRYQPVMRDGFENQNRIPECPAPETPIRLSRQYRQGFWYSENPEALLRLSKVHVLKGKQSGECDARLN